MTTAPTTRTEPASSARARITYERALEPLLGGQVQRLRRRYLVHGIGYLLLLPSLALLVAFLLDHTLRLPVAIRLLHSATIAALLVFVAVRFVLYPLGRRLLTIDIAQVLELTFPELHQRLVSAVQFADQRNRDLRNQSPEMIDAAVAEAAEATAQLPLNRFLDPRRTRLVLAGAFTALLVLLVGAATNPDTASIFALRHLGIGADYPRETYLSVDLPEAGPELQRVDRDGVTELLMPAGSELHVSVLATGVVPKEVFLDVRPLATDTAEERASSRRRPRSIAMNPRPQDRFRYVFRKVAGSFEFHARGGDDERGDRTVVVRTIRPPGIASIRAIVSPPAYTREQPFEQVGGGIEALIGSEVELSATTTTAVQSATMVFLESGRRIELDPVALQDDGGDAASWRARFRVQASDRYQIELVDRAGLRNPEPGTYPIAALTDYAPVGRWLLPDEQSTLLLENALLCVRLEARDDFGLSALDLLIERSGKAILEKPLLAAADPGASTPFPRSSIPTELIDLQPLLAGGAAAGRAAGDGLSIAIRVRDNGQPAPGEVDLPRRIVQIVALPQLAESIAKRFRRLREETERALDIQLDRRQRLEGLQDTESPAADSAALVLSAVEIGQNRVRDTCERLHLGLMKAFDTHLWNRLEPSENAAAVVDLYREFSARLDRPLAHDRAFYRELASRREAGTIGALETALDPILQMVVIADRLADEQSAHACRLLTEIQVALPADRPRILAEALALQQQIADALGQLLLRLQEWNDYQDLVQEARALRDRQRDLRTRTEELRGKK